ncbi:MAG: TonB-dependent receptor [Hyphomonadaceae bacterium]|nr:TonB-dependent receptor [Hyphomonadaceae bacterium]
MKFRTNLLLATVALTALTGPVAVAQETDDSQVDEGRKLSTVTVTAQRKEETLQDVPVTVTAFGADAVREARILGVGDVVVRTPGLNFDAFPSGQPRLAVRGIGSSDTGAGGDPSSAVFLDEIYLGRPAAVAFDAFDIERIEVLKGPQGTLYGRNVVGGAINVVPAAPVLGEFDASAEVTGGNYETMEGAGFINIPLADGTAAFRASGAIRKHDGYIDNKFTGGKLDDKDTRSMRLQMLVEPTDTLEFDLAFDVTTDRANGPAHHVVDVDSSDPLSGFWTIERDRDSSRAEFDGAQDRDTWGLRGEAKWTLPFGTLDYLVSNRELSYYLLFDFDGGNPTFNPISVVGGGDEDSTLFSQELRLNSLPSSPVSWVAGIYQYHADTTRESLLGIGIGGPPGYEILNQDAQVDSTAVYGDVTFPVSDRLSLIGGVRYTLDDKDFGMTTAQSQALFQVDEHYDITASESWDAVTWRAGADFDLSDEHMFYAMVSRGFKSGGFVEVPVNAEAAATPFDPEYATQYEIGQRGEFLNGSVIWNNTLYWMDYTDLQTEETIGLTTFTTNAGAATIRGYETAFQIAFSDNFLLGGTYAYTDATFDTFISGDNDYSGNRISRTPEHKLVLSPSYEYQFGSGALLKAALDYQYASKIFDDNSNVGTEFRDPTNFVDMRLIYESADGHWNASLWGKNITDEVTRTFQATFLGANFAAYNPPPTYGVTLRWNY